MHPPWLRACTDEDCIDILEKIFSSDLNLKPVIENALRIGPFRDDGSPHLIIAKFLYRSERRIPWVPETFLARFPVSVKSFAARGFGLRPTPKIPAAREKNLWYPG